MLKTEFERKLREKFPKAAESFIQHNVKEFKESKLVKSKIPSPKKDFKVLEEKFLKIWRSIGGHEPLRQFHFSKDRQWRSDFAFLDEMILIEIDGGYYDGGGHQRFHGIVNDRDKDFEATMLGYTVLRLWSKQLTEEHLTRLLAFMRIKYG